MIVLGALDFTALGTLGALITAIVAAIIGYRKVKPETESIATRTTLEVLEAVRGELTVARSEADNLRKRLQESDERFDALQRRFNVLRSDFDVLEAELNSLRGTAAP